MRKELIMTGVGAMLSVGALVGYQVGEHLNPEPHPTEEVSGEPAYTSSEKFMFAWSGVITGSVVCMAAVPLCKKLEREED